MRQNSMTTKIENASFSANDLATWLKHLEQLHPNVIELGSKANY